MRNRGAQLGTALGAALALHTLAVLTVALILPRTTPLPEPEPEPMAAELVTSADLPEDLPAVHQQVVRVNATPGAPPPPEDTPYIAEHDSNVEKETRPAHPSEQFQPRIGTPHPGGLTVERPRDEVSARQEPTEQTQKAPGQVVPEDVRNAETVPTRAAPVESAEATAERSAEPMPEASAAGPTEQPGDPAPLVSLGVGGDTDDMLPDLPVGASASVDAKASPLAAYLNEVRTRVRPRFRARQAYEKADPQRRFRGDVLAARVDVRVLSDGRIDRAEVKRSSGLPMLDQEAVAAFARAEPFPPPAGALLDARGGVEFSFEFVVTIRLDRFRLITRQRLAAEWQPSRAFRQNGDRERVTTARMLLTPEGTVAHAAVIGSAGIDFLDRGVLETLRRSGLQLPKPPREYGLVSGRVPVWVEFHHRVKADPVVRVLAPAERPQLAISGR